MNRSSSVFTAYTGNALPYRVRLVTPKVISLLPKIEKPAFH